MNNDCKQFLLWRSVTTSIQNLRQVEPLGEHHIESWPDQLKQSRA
jgi:hypothetical protein